MANATSTQLQELYVAYFGRAADPTGLDYWTEKGITTTKFAADMYAQAEFKDAYGSLSTESQVNQIYQNLFDREADVTGLTYWTQQINLGNLKVAEIATHLIWAAQNNSGSADDKTALTNRTNAAVAYTAKVKESTSAILAYQAQATSPTFIKGSNITEAINYLSGIDKDTAHTAAGIAASVTVISNNGVPTAAVAGKSVILTTSSDVINSTNATAALTVGEGNDVIYGLTSGLLTSGDVIDGAGGTDKITAKITASSNTVKPTLTSIETVEVEVSAAEGSNLTIDVSSTDKAVSTLTITSQDIATTADDTQLTLKGVQTTDTVSITGPTTGKYTDTILTYDSVTGSADSATVTLGGNQSEVAISGIETLSVTTASFVGSLTAQDAETVTITTSSSSTTKNSTVTDILQTSADLATLNLAGSGEGLVVGNTTDINFKGNAVVNITNTGSTTVNLDNLAATTRTLTVTGAGGADSVDIDSVTRGTITVNTGAGDDTVTINSGTVTVNTGAGNDIVAATTMSNVTTADSIDMGAGTLDRIQTSDTTINSGDKTIVGYFSNAEIVESTATTTKIFDVNGLSIIDHVIDSGGVASTGATTSALAGTDGIAATVDSEDIIELRASVYGENGGSNSQASTGATGAAGGVGIDIDAKVDTGSNVATIRFLGAITVKGGTGETSAAIAASTAGNGGDAMNADTIDTLNLIGVTNEGSTGTQRTVTFTAGESGPTGHANAIIGTAGNTITMGTNSKIVLTNELDPFTSSASATNATGSNHSNFTLGTINGGTNIEVDGSALLGALSVTAATGNVTIKGGAGADTLTGGAGIDTISGGAGNDTIDAGAGVDSVTTGAGADHIDIEASDAGTGTTTIDTITDYTAGEGGDVLDAYSTTLIGNATGTNVASAITAAAGTDTLTANVVNGFITLAGNATAKIDTVAEINSIFALLDTNSTTEIGAIEMSGDTYVMLDSTSNAVVDAVKLTGLTGITAVSTTAASNTITIV